MPEGSCHVYNITLAPVVLSVVVTISVVTMVILITTISAMLSCFLLNKHKTASKSTTILTSPVIILLISYEAARTTEDVVLVSSNPAYGEVTMSSKNIKMNENSAYAMVHPTVPAVPYYENISVGVMSVECKDNAKHIAYENVQM